MSTQKNYSLVANNITFHILLLIVIHFGILAEIVNIETGILYGDLEEETIWSVLKVCPRWNKVTALF